MPRVSGNPFWEAVDETRIGTRVHVQAPEGQYEGYAAYFEYDSRSLLLRDATTPAGEHVDTVLLTDPSVVESASPGPQSTVTEVPVEETSAQPYSVRTFDTPNFQAFVRDVRQDGCLSNLPTIEMVRAVRDEIERQVQTLFDELDRLVKEQQASPNPSGGVIRSIRDALSL